MKQRMESTKARWPTSPRSIEACLRQGIDPSSLKLLPFDHYLKKYRSHSLATLAYDYHKKSILKVFEMLEKERNLIPHQGQAVHEQHEGLQGAISSKDMQNELVQRELKRMQVMKKRQEREIRQIEALESARKALEKAALEKVKERQRRAAVRDRLKRKAAREMRKKIEEKRRLKEKEEDRRKLLQRKKEVETRERELKLAEVEDRKRAERNRQRLRQEALRRNNEENAKKELERSLQIQRTEEDRKRAAIEARERLIEVRKAQKRKNDKVVRMQRQMAANQRILAAQKASAAEALLKRDKLTERLEHSQQRLQATRAAAEKANDDRIREAKEKACQRRKKLIQDIEKHEQIKMEAAQDKARKLVDKQASQEEAAEKESAKKALLHKLRLESRVAQVEISKRREAYRMHKARVRLQEEGQRADALLKQRAQLREAARVANAKAAIEMRHLVESLAKKNKIS